MLVKDDKKQLSFLFQKSDLFFEMGYKLLEQEKLPQQLSYRRKRQNGREKIVYLIDDSKLVAVKDIREQLESSEILDILYELFLLIEKIERNGFMKRECIWCSYENVYYDTDAHRIKVALLPISKTVRYADGRSWHECLENTVSKLVEGLDHQIVLRVEQLVHMLTTASITVEEILLELERLGDGKSGLSADQLLQGMPINLRLYYSGKDKRLEFVIKDRDFIIGKSADKADGIIDETISKAVSRQHCCITRLGNRFFVQDLESVNRTLVNGIMIPPYEFMELENNDILSVADIEFRVTLLEHQMETEENKK